MRHLFNHDFIHKRLTQVPDGGGGWVYEWVTLGTIRGRLRVANMQDRFIASALQLTLDYLFYCGPNEDIRRGDRIVLESVTVGGTGLISPVQAIPMGDLIVLESLTIEIIGVKSPSFAGHHLECEGKAVTA